MTVFEKFHSQTLYFQESYGSFVGWYKYFARSKFWEKKNLHSDECAPICCKSVVMLWSMPAAEYIYQIVSRWAVVAPKKLTGDFTIYIFPHFLFKIQKRFSNESWILKLPSPYKRVTNQKPDAGLIKEKVAISQV